MPTHRLAESQRPTVSAVGEFAYKETLRKVPGGQVWLQLIPEPDNPHDPKAISIRYQGRVVAYIPRDKTGRYWANVCRVIASGKTPGVKANVYHNNSTDYHEVTLYILAGPKGIGNEKGLIPKRKSYKVPDAYQGKPRRHRHDLPLDRPHRSAHQRDEPYGHPRPISAKRLVETSTRTEVQALPRQTLSLLWKAPQTRPVGRSGWLLSSRKLRPSGKRRRPRTTADAALQPFSYSLFPSSSSSRSTERNP